MIAGYSFYTDIVITLPIFFVAIYIISSERLIRNRNRLDSDKT